jgi:hypothetical protein
LQLNVQRTATQKAWAGRAGISVRVSARGRAHTAQAVPRRGATTPHDRHTETGGPEGSEAGGVPTGARYIDMAKG